MKQVFDFHSHSYFSDGALSPHALMRYAEERNIAKIALTDHDSVSGLAEAHQAIGDLNLSLTLLDGVEISAMTRFGEVHIVGLGIDATNNLLRGALECQRSKRWSRAESICRQLEKAGVVGVLDATQSLVKEVVTRTHIAKSIMTLGYAKDMKQVFKRYIGKEGRIKVAKDWMSLAQAISLINVSGGIAILAHPTRYPLSNRKLSSLISEFAGEDGAAIEGAYPGISNDQMIWLKARAEASSLALSSGSDFHYPDLKWTDLGRFPSTDSQFPHVAERFNYLPTI